jgi:DNA-binding CsgD family transcriptional regulator
MLKDNISFNSYGEIKEISQPLISSCGLSYFGFCRLLPKQSFFNLATDWHWPEYHYLEKGLPPMKFGEFSALQDGVFLPALNQDEEYGWPDGTIRAVNERFNINNPLLIIKKQNQFAEMFLFTSNLLNANEFYINNLDIFENFIFYFKDKATKLIDKATKSPLFYKNNKIFTLNDEAKKSINKERLKNLLKPKIYQLFYNEKIHYISKRQYDVLSFIAQGYTYKETADKLNLSPRTIESYIDILKNTFGVTSKSRLLDIYLQNRYIPF